MKPTEKEIGIASNIARLKYAELETHFAKLNVAPETDKFVILFDLSYHLSMMDFFCRDGEGDNKKVDEEFKDSDLTEALIMRLVIGLLNNGGHYKNFIQSKLKCGAVLVFYSSDPKMYERYAVTFDKMNKLVNLFRKVIFIEKLDASVPFIYQHMAYFTAMNLTGLNSTKNKKTRLIYIGNNQIANQLYRLDRNMINITHKSFVYGTDGFFKNLDIENTPPGYRDTNLITSMFALTGVRTVYPKLDSLRGIKSRMIYRLIRNNCNNFVDKDNTTNITNGLYLSARDEEFFKQRLHAIDVDFHDKLYDLSKKLLSVWSSKVDTNQVYNLNNQFQLKDLTLNVNWLS